MKIILIFESLSHTINLYGVKCNLPPMIYEMSKDAPMKIKKISKLPPCVSKNKIN